ncbi:MAG: formimidoylglutamase [Gracilimonas sp.]|uniref:formimidoylglutamase n=1 Tax=Gracilimonas sp. TaxID=1974203 RepID=UPI0019B24737|nr:formimidoylglutamase [Gracilimonas sp.]MBD3617591.1 formimidoylglutamase [Gracilimonas sp.]
MGIEKLKDILNPVSEELRQLRSHDKHDHWLVQEIRFEEQGYSDATYVLIGCPQHEGVRRNSGRVGAAEAPDKIREQLYKLQVEEDLSVRVFDAGNVIADFFDFTDDTDSHEINQTPDALEEIHNRLTKAVSKFLRDGKKVIVLGGGNDISYADVRALSAVERDISALNIDAHLDMRNAERITSGTPYRKLIEDGYLNPRNLHEFGIRRESNGAFYLNSAYDLGVHIHYLSELIKEGVAESFQNIIDEIGEHPFFLGLDMDSIQAADAPGVSACSPNGLSGREVMQIIHYAKPKENLKLFEITEVNPKYDIDNRTVKLAAQLVYGFLFGQ